MAKVLVVDDRLFMLRYIEHVVTQAGHNPIRARNSVEVTEALSKEEPAIVVMDLCPGEMQSVQKALCDRPSTKLIPVILMSELPNQPPTSSTGALKPAVVFH